MANGVMLNMLNCVRFGMIILYLAFELNVPGIAIIPIPCQFVCVVIISVSKPFGGLIMFFNVEQNEKKISCDLN